MRLLIGVLVVIVLGLGAVKLMQDVTAEETPTAALPRATAYPIEEPFWGRVKKFSAVSNKVLEFKVRLLNTGNQPSVGECDVVAYDKTGAVASLPVSTETPATPGFGVILTKRLRIQQGAAAIQRVEVAC